MSNTGFIEQILDLILPKKYLFDLNTKFKNSTTVSTITYIYLQTLKFKNSNTFFTITNIYLQTFKKKNLKLTILSYFR